MWILVAILVAGGIAAAAVHIYRWPLFNAAIRAQRAKAGLEERTVNIDGHEVVYLDGGDGEPLILLHGFGANKDNWSQIAPLLSPYFRLIIPDLPGFGDSTRDDDARYGADEQLARLESFIAALDLGPVHLGGNSMGGYLVGLYAARHPSAVKSQWLLAPAGVAAATASEYFESVERGENPLLVNGMSDFRRLMALCFTRVPYLPHAFRRCLCERNVAERKFNEKIFAEMFTDPLALEQELEGSPVKTQILWGDNDRILHRSGARILGEVINGAQTLVMKRMGHCPMLERPRETADHYLRFHGIA
jgi:pimeloyl-ACP methyl ester carboxylesterase